MKTELEQTLEQLRAVLDAQLRAQKDAKAASMLLKAPHIERAAALSLNAQLLTAGLIGEIIKELDNANNG